MSLDNSIVILKTKSDTNFEFRANIVHAIGNLTKFPYIVFESFCQSPVFSRLEDAYEYCKTLEQMQEIEHGICVIRSYEEKSFEYLKGMCHDNSYNKR